jgi:hypothetical protein
MSELVAPLITHMEKALLNTKCNTLLLLLFGEESSTALCCYYSLISSDTYSKVKSLLGFKGGE